MKTVRVTLANGEVHYADAERVGIDGGVLVVATNDRRTLTYAIADLVEWSVKRAGEPWERNLVADGTVREQAA